MTNYKHELANAEMTINLLLHMIDVLHTYEFQDKECQQ